METLNFTAMGSRVNAIWDSEDAPPDGWFQIAATFEVWEQCLSRFRPDSELSRLNANAGVPTLVSPTLAQVLAVAQQAATLSQGLVLPTMLPYVEATGYTFDFKAMVAHPERVVPTTAPARVAHGALQVDMENRIVTVPIGARVDVGGVAKGWAAHTLAQHFGTLAPVLFEIGGDIAVSGLRADGNPWAIGITNPLTPDDPTPLTLALLSGGGIATSGRDYRQWRVGERAYHHIIDPRAGAPADTDVLTATVVAPTTIEAEVAAKVVLLQGSVAGLQWLEQHPTYAAFVVTENGDVRTSRRWQQYEWRA